MEKISFSLILPTYNAAAELSLALSSLKKNSFLDNELIVVVDALKEGGVNKEVLKVLEKAGIKPLINKENLGPYKSWNKGAKKATKPWLCFLTDDQYFAPGWDKALGDFCQKGRILTSQLVEPGIIPVWPTNIKKDFGQNPQEFREKDFLEFVKKQERKELANDGFFIPLVIHREDFWQIGGFPVEGEFGSRDAPANDIAFIKKAKAAGFEFKKALNSFSYHFQGSSWRRKKKAEGISVVIISRNEEPRIRQCLLGAKKVADEIVLVLGSREKGNVLEEAQKVGAKIFYRPFDNYSNQKNFAISKARGDWIFSLDADEEISSSLTKELKEVTADLSYNGYLVPRQNIIFGKKIRGGGWWPDEQLRFFVKGFGQFFGLIHERVIVRGGVGKLKSPLIHYNYDSLEGFIDRLNRYTSFEAEKLVKEGYSFSQKDCLTRPIEEFLGRFFAQKGWLDGFHGLALALLQAFYTLVIYLKVWQKEGFAFMKPLSDKEIQKISREKKKEFCYWRDTYLIEKEENSFKRFFLRLRRKIFYG